MSRETRIAIEHSTPMPQHSESGVSARYESKVLSLWDQEAAKLTPFPDEIGLDTGTAVLAELQSALTAQFCLRVFE
jgi:hypothetical protein